MKKKSLISLIISVLIFFSCGITTKIELQKAGKLTLVSTKNVNFSKDYALLSKSAGFDESQIEGLNNKKNKEKNHY